MSTDDLEQVVKELKQGKLELDNTSWVEFIKGVLIENYKDANLQFRMTAFPNSNIDRPRYAKAICAIVDCALNATSEDALQVVVEKDKVLFQFSGSLDQDAGPLLEKASFIVKSHKHNLQVNHNEIVINGFVGF